MSSRNHKRKRVATGMLVGSTNAITSIIARRLLVAVKYEPDTMRTVARNVMGINPVTL